MPPRLCSLADQGLISAANLVSFLIFARHVAPEAWGQFGFAYAIVLFAQGFQRALIIIPLITFRTTWANVRVRWQEMNLALALAIATLLSGVALLAVVVGGGWFTNSAMMSAMMVVPVFMHEFARRSAIQEGRWLLLVAMAAIYAMTTVISAASLPLIPWPNWLPALTVTFAATGAALVYAVMSRFWPLVRFRLWSPAPDYPQFAGWAVASHLSFSGYNFGVQAVLGAVAGPAAVGVFHACRIFVQPVATLIGATDSVDKPRAARALAERGATGLRQVLLHSLLTMMTLALPYLLLLAVFADALLRLAFADQYLGEERVVWLWCVVGLSMLMAQPVESGLYVARRTRRLFFGRVFASVVGLGFAYPLAIHWGASGALIAIACGYMVAGAFGVATLRRVSERA